MHVMRQTVKIRSSNKQTGKAETSITCRRDIDKTLKALLTNTETGNAPDETHFQKKKPGTVKQR